MKNLKFAFFGTPDIASQTLDILFEHGYIPSLIITSPDKPAGRGLHLTPSAVSEWANKYNIPCLKPEKITPEFIDKLKFPHVGHVDPHMSDMWPILFIVVAYGKILPEALIHTPELGTINIHYSLLPKYRGASPLSSTLLNGDTITGVSIQQMAFKLDSGPILATKEISIDEKETKEELKNKLIKIGGDLLCEILPKIIERDITSKIQDESKATYCKKIKKEDGEIDINGNPIENYNKYRAFYGWPGTYFFIEKHDKPRKDSPTGDPRGKPRKDSPTGDPRGKRIKITKARYENNSFIIEKVIPEGKKEVSYEDFLRQN